eukprot:517535-Hanusia_phi.AAC.1
MAKAERSLLAAGRGAESHTARYAVPVGPGPARKDGSTHDQSQSVMRVMIGYEGDDDRDDAIRPLSGDMARRRTRRMGRTRRTRRTDRTVERSSVRTESETEMELATGTRRQAWGETGAREGGREGGRREGGRGEGGRGRTGSRGLLGMIGVFLGVMIELSCPCCVNKCQPSSRAVQDGTSGVWRWSRQEKLRLRGEEETIIVNAVW